MTFTLRSMILNGLSGRISMTGLLVSQTPTRHVNNLSVWYIGIYRLRRAFTGTFRAVQQSLSSLGVPPSQLLPLSPLADRSFPSPFSTLLSSLGDLPSWPRPLSSLADPPLPSPFSAFLSSLGDLPSRSLSLSSLADSPLPSPSSALILSFLGDLPSWPLPPPPLEILSCRRSPSPILEILPHDPHPSRLEVFPRDRSPSPPLDILPLGRSCSPRLKIFTPRHHRPLCHLPHSLRSSSPFLYDRSPSPSSEILPHGRSPSPLLEIIPRNCSPSPPFPRGRSPSPSLEILPRGRSPPPVLEIFPRSRSSSPSLGILPRHRPRSPRLGIAPHRRPLRYPLRSPNPYRRTFPLPVTIDPRNCSMMLLAITELWVALDKLVLKKLLILAEYSPEVPLYLLYGLLLHDATSIDRFCRARQYISARHAQARCGWSVLSDTFTEDSFPCRYYDKQLQHIKLEGELLANPLHAKVVLYELQCPVAFDKWRSVTCLLSRIKPDLNRDRGDIEVGQIPALKSHFPTNFKRSLSLYSSYRFYCVYDGPCMGGLNFVYKLPAGPYTQSGLQAYLGDTIPWPNQALAAQRECHPKFPLQAFIAFAHLRSGGSLQWLNILRELRSRTLDFRHQEVYLLFAQASAKVGPVDDTGVLSWHQEMKDSSFCHALLEELKSLFIDICTGSSNGPAMAIVTCWLVYLPRDPLDVLQSKPLTFCAMCVRRHTAGCASCYTTRGSCLWMKRVLNFCETWPLSAEAHLT